MSAEQKSNVIPLFGNKKVNKEEKTQTDSQTTSEAALPNSIDALPKYDISEFVFALNMAPDERVEKILGRLFDVPFEEAREHVQHYRRAAAKDEKISRKVIEMVENLNHDRAHESLIALNELFGFHGPKAAIAIMRIQQVLGS